LRTPGIPRRGGETTTARLAGYPPPYATKPRNRQKRHENASADDGDCPHRRCTCGTPRMRRRDPHRCPRWTHILHDPSLTGVPDISHDETASGHNGDSHVTGRDETTTSRVGDRHAMATPRKASYMRTSRARGGETTTAAVVAFCYIMRGSPARWRNPHRPACKLNRFRVADHEAAKPPPPSSRYSHPPAVPARGGEIAHRRPRWAHPFYEQERRRRGGKTTQRDGKTPHRHLTSPHPY